MRLIFSICHEIEKLNYYSNTPSEPFPLDPALLKTSMKPPPSPGGSRSINQELAEERMNRNNIRVAGPEVINKTCVNGKRGQHESVLILHNNQDHTQ